MSEARPTRPLLRNGPLRDFVIALAIILGLSLVVSGGTVFSYLGILFASAIRNVYFEWVGNGILFYALVAVGLLLEAAFLTVLLRLGRRVL